MTAFPYIPSEFRDVLHASGIVCAHCKQRAHPAASFGCYDGEFSIRDGSPYSYGPMSPTYSATSARRDQDAVREALS